MLDEAVVYGIREGVEAGLATSQSRLVQDAVVEYLDAANRKALGEAYADAARDPKFLADIERVRGDFERADEEITEG